MTLIYFPHVESPLGYLDKESLQVMYYLNFFFSSVKQNGKRKMHKTYLSGLTNCCALSNRSSSSRRRNNFPSGSLPATALLTPQTSTMLAFIVLTSRFPYRYTLISFCHFYRQLNGIRTFLVAQMVMNLPARQETQVQSLGQEDSPGEGTGNPLQYSHLENPMDERTWWATVHGVAKSRTRLSN